jgi:hypothetical protein
MTIVLQHRFWDLSVSDDRFEVKLTFDGIPERLVVPFSAIKVFFDPSVRYGLQFAEPDFNSDIVDQSVTSLEASYAGLNGDSDAEHPNEPTPLPGTASRRANARRRDNGGADDASKSGQHETALNGNSEQPSGKEPTDAGETGERAASAGAEIVSLDAFRKK